MIDKKYQFTRVSLRGGEIVHKEVVEIDGERLFREVGWTGEFALMALLNKWNRYSAESYERTGILYVYYCN